MMVITRINSKRMRDMLIKQVLALVRHQLVKVASLGRVRAEELGD